VTTNFPLGINKVYIYLSIYSLSGLAGEQVKRLQNRVDALEAITGTASARTSRLSASSGINVIDPLDASYIDSSSSGATLTRSGNGINLGAAGPGGGAGSGPGQDGAALQRAVQQLVRAELRSDAARGAETQHTDELSSHELTNPHNRHQDDFLDTEM